MRWGEDLCDDGRMRNEFLGGLMGLVCRGADR